MNRAAGVLTQIDLPGLRKLKSGKVREVFDLGERLLIVATDRISAFDCVMPNGIPDKGSVLNQLSAWWFDRTRDLVPNHLLSTRVEDFPEPCQPCAELLRGRSMLVRRAEPIPIECVARGYLIGSGWKDYQRTGSVCGIRLRPGYRMAEKLDEPLFTPATKASSGHDENISFAEVESRVGADLARRLRDTTLRLYTFAADYAARRGIIIADTKFEFGLDENGRLMLIDEILTPDSSRFWPAESYQVGVSPPSFDKQYVRDYLESLAWDKSPPAPVLPPDVVARTRQKYLEAFARLTGRPFSAVSESG